MARLTLLLFLLLPLGVCAQSPDSCRIRLNGRLLDEHDASALDLATLWLVEAGQGAATDSLGQFELAGLCPGWHTIQYSHIGCEPGETRFFLQKDTTVILQLEHHARWLQSVTVRAQRMASASVQNKTDLSGWELDQVKGASLAQSIASVSGVRMLQTGPGVAKPVIHGLHSNRIAIYNNGLRQEGQEWGVDHPPEIDPFSADRIRVIKGTAALQYGIGAMGGVVLTEPAPLPVAPGLKGDLMLIGQTNGRQGTLASKWQGGWKKLDGFGWRVQGSLHRSGDWTAPHYQLTNTGAAQGAGSVELGYQKGRVSTTAYYSFFQSNWGVLRSAHIGNVSDFLEAIQRDTPIYVLPFSYTIDAPRQWTRHHLAKAEVEFRPEKTGIWNFVYGFQHNARQEFDLRRAGRTAKPALDMALSTQQGSLSWRPFLAGTSWHTSLGLSFEYQQNRNVPGTGVKPLIPWFNSTTAGIYGISHYIRSRWEAEAGIRFDTRQLLVKRFDSQDNLLTEKLPFHGFSASAGAAFHPGKDWTARTQIGTTFRPPHVSELYSDGLHHAVASLEQGAPLLSSEKAVKWVAGLELHPNNRLHIQLEGYFTYIRDFIYLEPGPEPVLTIRGVFPVFQYTQTDATIVGVDADVHWEMIPRLSIDLSSSILRSRDLRQDTYLIYMPADRVEAALQYDLKTNKKVSDAHLSVKLARTGQQSRAPEDIDLLPPPDAYTLVEASASCRLLIGKRAVSFFLNATNLLNTSYRDYLNRLRYYADEPGRNIELRIKLNL